MWPFWSIGIAKLALLFTRRCSPRIRGLMPHRLDIADWPVRLTLIGCGCISAKHLEALRQYAARGLALIDTWRAESSVGIAVFAAPNGLHVRRAMKAAQAGRHVLAEAAQDRVVVLAALRRAVHA
jgi:hypothetical protein